MNRRYEQEIEYANVNELLKHLEVIYGVDEPLNTEVIKKEYRRLFGRHMPKRVSNKVIQVLERGA